MKRTARQLRIQTAVVTVAVLLILAGSVFGLVAAYLALAAVFSPAEAAGLLAALMILAGLAVLAGRTVMARWRDSRGAHEPQAVASSLNASAEEITRSLGPAHMIALSLIAGMAAGRSLRK